MKSILLILSIFSLTIAQAQNLQTHFGLKGGINISSLKVDGGQDYDAKPGIHIGGLAHVHISRHIAIQPELLYSTQGGKDGNFKFKFDYINIPLLLQIMTGSGFRIETGPQLGFMVSGKQKDGDIEEDIKDELSTIDVSWAFGAGYLTSSGFGLDARFNLGLTNVNEDDFPEVKNRVFQVGVFYQFMHTQTRRRR